MFAAGCVDMNPGAKCAADAATLETSKKWFKEAQFGMMAHWGLYTLLGGEWKGKPGTHPYGEWIMHGNRIPLKEYAALGSNYMLNVGPDPLGRFPVAAIDILDGLAKA